ncbi:Cyclin-dependent kinase regulatory subunit family protein [Cryptosporidium felis]|nr:Cyclin-dependent kinase regulatory subunit family protein [Cryptosporidium felis]
MRSPYAEEVEYSEKFNMDTHEYRFVKLTRPLYKKLQQYRATRGNGPLISEDEWRHVLGETPNEPRMGTFPGLEKGTVGTML